MKIEYYVVDPSKNITALVTTPIDNADKKEIAKAIMINSPDIEQVGFLSEADGKNTLVMSGNEFCGNALMSAATVVYYLKGLKGEASVIISFSDFGDYEVKVKKEDNAYFCTSVIDGAKDIGEITFSDNEKKYTFPAFSVRGITHIIADSSLKPETAANLIKDVAKDINDAAVGIMIFDKNGNKVTPIVYVKDVDTVCFENSCASGTIALCYMNGSENGEDYVFRGGIIHAKKQTDGVCLMEKIHLKEKAEDILYEP